MPSSLPGLESAGQCCYRPEASTLLPSAGALWSSSVDFIPHRSFFSIGAHLFATSSPPPKSFPDKQPTPDYFLTIGPGFATAIPNCGISRAITHAVTALHGVTGRDTRCGQPGSPQLPHGCPIGLSLPPMITRHNYSMLALIPVQADQVLAGPYLAVYILESSSRGTCLSLASVAAASAL